MQNLSDDELDNVFKKAADDLKPAFNPAHWDELNAKLGQTATTSSWNKNLMGGIVALLVITGGIGVYMWTTSSTNTNKADKKSAGIIDSNSLTKSDKNSNSVSLNDGSVKESLPVRESTDNSSKTTSMNNASDKEVVHDNVHTNESVPVNAHATEGIHSNTRTRAVVPVKKESINNASGKELESRNDKSKSNSTNSVEDKRTKPDYASSLAIEKRDVSRNDQTASERERRSREVIATTPTINNNALSSTKENSSTDEHSNNVNNINAENVAEVSTKSSENKTQDATKNPNKIDAKQIESIENENSGRDQTDVSVGLASNKVEDSNENQEALQDQSTEGKGQVNATATQAVASDFQKDSLQEKNSKKEVDEIAEKQEKHDNDDVRENSIPKFSVKLALSPDFSAVKYSGYSKPGSNYGILLEYRMFPRLTVNAGAIWSRKVYTADDIEYNGHKIDETDGDCRILDIPINLNYHFKSSRSLSLFAGIGVSSYLMNREEYVFTSIGAYGDAYSYKREFKGKNNELFSVLNVSVGIQKQLTSRMAIQLEPFVKQPVKGIGEGDLSLSSVGAFLNLRYAIIK